MRSHPSIFDKGSEQNEQYCGHSAPRVCALADSNGVIHGNECHIVSEYIQHSCPGRPPVLFDAVIDTAAILLDPFAAFVVGGIGSFLGDFFFYPAPMFVSLVTHGLQAVIVSVISHKLLTKKPVVSSSIAVTVGAVIMVLGYTLGRAYIYSTPEYAILKLPFQILQAGFGAIVSVVLIYPMRIGALFQRILYD